MFDILIRDYAAILDSARGRWMIDVRSSTSHGPLLPLVHSRRYLLMKIFFCQCTKHGIFCVCEGACSYQSLSWIRHETRLDGCFWSSKHCCLIHHWYVPANIFWWSFLLTGVLIMPSFMSLRNPSDVLDSPDDDFLVVYRSFIHHRPLCFHSSFLFSSNVTYAR